MRSRTNSLPWAASFRRPLQVAGPGPNGAGANRATGPEDARNRRRRATRRPAPPPQSTFTRSTVNTSAASAGMSEPGGGLAP